MSVGASLLPSRRARVPRRPAPARPGGPVAEWPVGQRGRRDPGIGVDPQEPAHSARSGRRCEGCCRRRSSAGVSCRAARDRAPNRRVAGTEPREHAVEAGERHRGRPARGWRRDQPWREQLAAERDQVPDPPRRPAAGDRWRRSGRRACRGARGRPRGVVREGEPVRARHDGRPAPRSRGSSRCAGAGSHSGGPAAAQPRGVRSRCATVAPGVRPLLQAQLPSSTATSTANALHSLVTEAHAEDASRGRPRARELVVRTLPARPRHHATAAEPTGHWVTERGLHAGVSVPAPT